MTAAANSKLLYELMSNHHPQIEAIKKLIYQADLNQQYADGNTILHVVAEKGIFDLIPLLLALGARPHLRNANNLLAYDLALTCIENQPALDTQHTREIIATLKQAEINGTHFEKETEKKLARKIAKEFSPLEDRIWRLLEEIHMKDKTIERLLEEIQKLKAQLAMSQVNKVELESDSAESVLPYGKSFR